MLTAGVSLTLVDISPASSMVMERASFDAVRFNRAGDNDRGEDGDAWPFGLVSSVMSIFVNTFLRGGKDAGLGFDTGLWESSLNVPRPGLRSGEASGFGNKDTVLEMRHIMIVPSKPVLTIVH